MDWYMWARGQAGDVSNLRSVSWQRRCPARGVARWLIGAAPTARRDPVGHGTPGHGRLSRPHQAGGATKMPQLIDTFSVVTALI
jgi:hypothetical protein